MKHMRGFTVLEMVIAFAILSLAVAAVYEGLGTALSRGARIDAIDSGIGLAESLLAEHSVDAMYEATEKEGVAGSYRWTVQTTPYSAVEGGGLESVPLVAVRVRVTWGRASPRERVDLARLAVARYPSR